MKLIDLKPKFLGVGGEGVYHTVDGKCVEAPERHGVAVSFDCPCGCDSRCCIMFNNPLDGLPIHKDPHAYWDRQGDTFETLTLSPSIKRVKRTSSNGITTGCGWHGYIKAGEIETCADSGS